MRQLLILVACLLCAISGRRVQNPSEVENSASSCLQTFVGFLLAFNPVAPPVARRSPHKVAFGKVAGENRGAKPMDPAVELVDDYFWLGDQKELDRNEQEILELLTQENLYTLRCTEPLEAFRGVLLDEMTSRVASPFASRAKFAAKAFGVSILLALIYTALNSVNPSLFSVLSSTATVAAVVSLLGGVFSLKEALADSAEYPSPAADGYEYWQRRDLSESIQYVRRQSGAASGEEVVLDLKALCTSSAFVQEPGWRSELCDVKEVTPSPSGKLLAYSVDGSGRENFNIRFKDLDTGVELVEQIRETNGMMAWAGDSTLFYVRGRQIWRHVLGTQTSEDVLVYEEADEAFRVTCSRSLDGSLIFIKCQSESTSEFYFIPTAMADSSPTLIRARQPGVTYNVDSHAPSRSLFLTSNVDDKKNGELFVASIDSPSTWSPVTAAGSQVLAHSAARSIESVDAFSSFLVVSGREDGFPQLWAVPLAASSAEATSDAQRIVFDDDVVTPELSTVSGLPTNTLFDSNGKLRVYYSSLIIPGVLVEYDIKTRASKTLKTYPVDNYDASLYKTMRTEVTARDGASVPVTLMWRPDAVGNAIEAGGGGVPCHLFGYGAYGESTDPIFKPERVSLADRGVACAIAHVRGGGEKGRCDWYEESGKWLNKKNTFNDFVDVAEALVERGIAKKGALACEGISAGGLLVGSVVNMAPQLFVAALADVPFVDLMVTMCDPSLGLTVLEWEEWGNPNEAKYHDYMKSYSPINNVRDGATYPSMLIYAGLDDARVGFWEAAKWVQVLRSRIANGDDVLLMMNEAGHSYSDGSGEALSGNLAKLAFQYAWLLDKLGKAS